MTDIQQPSFLSPPELKFSHEVAALQKVLLGAMVIHPQSAVPGVVSAISNPDAGIAHAARAFVESVVLPIALQETQHLNGSMKPHGLLSSVPADSFSALSLQQCLRMSLKSAYHGTDTQQSWKADCHVHAAASLSENAPVLWLFLLVVCPEHHLVWFKLAAELLHKASIKDGSDSPSWHDSNLHSIQKLHSGSAYRTE